jgi:acetyltransferase-like isoleucine patch superfamily enzyme
MPGVTIPEGCTVGAKSFVYTRNELTPWAVFIGTPPVLHKTRNKENVIRLSEDPNFLKQ